MEKLLPLNDDEGEVREFTTEDFKRFKPAREILPQILGNEIASELLNRKKYVTVKYSSEVLQYFRSTGKGWQTRMDEA